MENIKKTLLIADEDKKNKTDMENYFKNSKHFSLIRTNSSGTTLINDILLEAPDIVVMDIVLSGRDGFEVIERIKKDNIKSKIFVVTALTNDVFIQKAMNLGVDYYALKPVNFKVLEERMVESFESITKNVTNKPANGLDEKITNIFITVGIPAHIKGYYFLREAVKMAVHNPTIINSITKTLYPSIANKFETSASKVERAIRHAIEVAWNRGRIEKINNIFGIEIYVNNEKPTNGEFIALLADKMMLEG